MMRKILCLFALFGVLFACGEPASPYRFILQGEQGTVSDSDFPGQHLLVTFGYTHCPDICPTTLYELSKVMPLLAEKADKVQVIFISIDPFRDDPATLNRYVRYFDPRFIGLTDDYERLKTLGKAYGVTFGFRLDGEEITPPDLPKGHSVYHSTLIYLLSPDRRLLEVFNSRVKHPVVAKVLQQYL